ncbi:acyltransferase [Nocardioides sp. REDSEA-S30_B4]|jgi:peptidoglycan/LPS O-acetylase OafA/YrhL|uniref:acyltransferase family protein n=1 Tax=Nocardioides sp. REDSEA-S30_B4 TaxID=1811552 RepID=UPI000B177313|nr:acyltransferase [Nocardioides sp. REDSEA-S30_B4]
MSESRIAALQGLRGVAVLLVVISHSMTMAIDSTRWNDVGHVFFDGGFGVLVFFVLSGFLITGILTRERERTRTISIYNFYVRRFLRIIPAFAFFLMAMGVLTAVGAAEIPRADFLRASLLVSDYLPTGWHLGHTWSLSVEEQFYIFWPLTLLALNTRLACKVAVAAIVVLPILRVATYVLTPDLQPRIGIMFHTRADSLLIGCAVALLPIAYPKAWSYTVTAVIRYRLELVALPVILASSAAGIYLGGIWLLPFGYTVHNLAAAAVLVAVLQNRKSPLRRPLEWPPLVYVGLISYSLYLWQEPLLASGSDALPVIGETVFAPIAALLVAAASYRFIEAPFLALKSRFQRAPANAVAPASESA